MDGPTQDWQTNGAHAKHEKRSITSLSYFVCLRTLCYILIVRCSIFDTHTQTEREREKLANDRSKKGLHANPSMLVNACVLDSFNFARMDFCFCCFVSIPFINNFYICFNFTVSLSRSLHLFGDRVLCLQFSRAHKPFQSIIWVCSFLKCVQCLDDHLLLMWFRTHAHCTHTTFSVSN